MTITIGKGEKSPLNEGSKLGAVKVADYTTGDVVDAAAEGEKQGTDDFEEAVDDSYKGLIDGKGQLPIQPVVLLFLEKFVEIVVVLMFTLLASFRGPLLLLVQTNFWPLIGLALASMITLTVLYKIRWCRRFPGFLVFKLIYLFFLTDVFVILAIHVPTLLTFLFPFFAMVAEINIAATYVFFIFLIFINKHVCKVPAEGLLFWTLFLAVPLAIILMNQPIYFSHGIWHFNGYWDFIRNVLIGILLSLPFSWEGVFVYKRFTESLDLDEFFNHSALVPGFMTVYYSSEPANNNETYESAPTEN